MHEIITMVSEKPDDKEHGIVFVIGFFFFQKYCYSETMFLKGLTEKKPQFIIKRKMHLIIQEGILRKYTGDPKNGKKYKLFFYSFQLHKGIS